MTPFSGASVDSLPACTVHAWRLWTDSSHGDPAWYVAETQQQPKQQQQQHRYFACQQHKGDPQTSLAQLHSLQPLVWKGWKH